MQKTVQLFKAVTPPYRKQPATAMPPVFGEMYNPTAQQTKISEKHASSKP